VLAALAVFCFFLVAHLIYPAGLGMGDVKLGAFLGAGLGRYSAAALLVGLAAAAIVAIGILVREGASARKKSMPFGPFLALGGLVALYSQGF
jgi:leader peptidase (prepilin peptidase)/N-methyltransferase